MPLSTYHLDDVIGRDCHHPRAARLGVLLLFPTGCERGSVGGDHRSPSTRSSARRLAPCVTRAERPCRSSPRRRERKSHTASLNDAQPIIYRWCAQRLRLDGDASGEPNDTSGSPVWGSPASGTHRRDHHRPNRSLQLVADVGDGSAHSVGTAARPRYPTSHRCRDRLSGLSGSNSKAEMELRECALIHLQPALRTAQASSINGFGVRRADARRSIAKGSVPSARRRPHRAAACRARRPSRSGVGGAGHAAAMTAGSGRRDATAHHWNRSRARRARRRPPRWHR